MTISRERFTNAETTSLDGGINNSVTTLDVNDGSSFPTAYFRIKVEDELMFCTSRSSNTLTVIRGQEGTTAASHADGVNVNHVLSAAGIQGLRKLILADVGLIDPTDSESSDDDDFDNESFSGWTLVERSGFEATIVERNHRATFLIPSGTDGNQFYGYVKAKVPSGGDYVQAGFQWIGKGLQYPMFGVGFSDGATYGAGNQAHFTYSPAQNQYYNRASSNWNANVSFSGGNTLYGQIVSAMHMRMVWNSADDYDCLVSLDGTNWITVFAGVTPGSVGTPSHAGIMLSNWAAADSLIAATYCRFSW